jgi:lipid II:glycine glycyltransferase (peptidoglycan interpeptide bridge formation enzyme)
MRMNFNTEQWNLFKAPTNNQPVDTIVLNTQKDESRLLKEMKRKTRYNIRLSHRHGVYVEDASPEKLPTWYRMYAETMQRKGIKVTPYEYFEALFKTQALRSQQEERDSKDVPAIGTVLKLFMASKDSEYVAGIVLAISRDYALYLYGASLPHKRFAMPTYKLQWEAIRMAQEYGCSWYDLHGVPANKSSTNPMYGLLQFKRGFGGSVVHRRGCWDFPIKRELYNQLQLQESMSSGYYC